MRGKHTDEAQKIKQLEETIKLRDKEIKDIKFSVSDILLQIRTLMNLMTMEIHHKEKEKYQNYVQKQDINCLLRK